MRDLQKIAMECLREVEALGIPVGTITKFEVNTRARSRWGQCKHYCNGTHTININISLLDERNDINGLKNTIIHEILHTCKGCQNHGPQWKAYAEKVNKKYGYGIKRCSSSEEKGVLEETQIKQKYAIQCKECGYITRKSRMCNPIRYPHHYKCAFCGGELVRIS